MMMLLLLLMMMLEGRFFLLFLSAFIELQNITHAFIFLAVKITAIIHLTGSTFPAVIQ